MKNLKIIIFYPALLFSVFLFDKVFLLDAVRDRFIQPGGMVFYRHRKELLEHFQHHTASSPHSITVVLGDSRSLGLGQEVANYIGRKDLDIWNFTGTQAVPAYHLFLAEKILDIHAPHYVFLGISPDAFNRNAGIFASPVLVYGVDEDFLQKYRNLIPEHDYEVYRNSRIFALAGLQFSLKTLFLRIRNSIIHNGNNTMDIIGKMVGDIQSLTAEEKRLLQFLADFQNEDLRYYDYYKSPIRHLLNMTKGAQYSWFGNRSDEELKKETEKLIRLYMQNFTVSYEQLIFTELLLSRLAEKNVKTVVFLPRVNPYLRNFYRTSREIGFITEQVKNLAEKYRHVFLDFNDDTLFSCNEYYDASHLSLTCFPEMLTILLRSVEK